MAVSRRIPRQRQDSHRSIESITPADDVSSWLGDDVCTNCGAPARANLLYCSQECKEEDAQGSDQKSRTSISAPTLTQYNMPFKEVSSTTAWRYPCPPSPNITAKYNSSLTSPALVALERSLPRNSSGKETSRGDRDTGSLSSSDDGSSAAADEQDKKRRSSSQSTFSTASDVFSTDRSSPSSTTVNLRDKKGHKDGDDDLDDDDEFEPSDLVLPPPVHSAASILLNSSSREARKSIATSSSITQDGLKRSPSSQSSSVANFGTNTNSKGTVKTDPVRKTIDFARRPSSTNLPAPVLFTSPTLTNAGSEVFKQTELNTEATRRRNSNGQGNLNSTKKEVARKLAAALGNSGKTSPSTVSAPTASPISGRYDASFIAVPRHVKGSIDSPPGIPSVSSSAGKTLRGISPAHSTSPGSGLCQGVVCGRYGCHGLGTSVESIVEVQENSLAPPLRLSLNRTHKHTHSAAAGLNYLGDHGNASDYQSTSLAARSKLLMTPVEDSKATFPTTQDVHTTDAMGDDQIERIKSPPRGRSKARGGRRSSSRRSPSPPRGAARRGHSEDFNKISRGQDDKNRDTSPSPSLSYQRGQSPEKTTQMAEEKRGRSPTERGNSLKDPRGRESIRGAKSSVLTSPKGARHPCEVAWPAQSHDKGGLGSEEEDFEEKQRAQLAKRAASAVLHGANGYDDVDLDEL